MVVGLDRTAGFVLSLSTNWFQTVPKRKLLSSTLSRSGDSSNQAAQFATDLSDDQGGAVKFGQRETTKLLVKQCAVIGHDMDGDRLAQLERLGIIGAPVNACGITPHRDVSREFVQLSSYRETRPVIRNQRQTIGSRDDRIGNDKRFIKPRLQNRDARARHGGVPGAVGRMSG